VVTSRGRSARFFSRAAEEPTEVAFGRRRTSTRRRRCAMNAPETLANIFCDSDIERSRD